MTRRTPLGMAELSGFRLTSPDTVFGPDITPSLFSDDDAQEGTMTTSDTGERVNAELRAANLVRFDPDEARAWLTADEDGNPVPREDEYGEARYLDYLGGPGLIDVHMLSQLVSDYCGDMGGPGFGEVNPLFWLDQGRDMQPDGCLVTVTVPNPADDGGPGVLRVAGTWQDIDEVVDYAGRTGDTVDRLITFLAWVARETHEMLARSFAAIERGAGR